MAKRFYSRGQRFLCAGVGVGVGVFLAALALIPDHNAQVSYRIFMVLLTALWAVAIGRVCGSEVRVDAGIVEIRNPIRRWRFPTDEVECFEERRFGLSSIAVVKVAGDREHLAWGLQSGNRLLRIGTRSLSQQVDELNALLASAGG